MTDVFRIGAKVYCTQGADLDLEVLIPIFHRWIQQKRTRHLLIDVADYSHVPAGPGILLVAHEGNYMLDDLGGRRGLTFYRKQPLAGSLGERLLAVAREAVGAAQVLAAEPELAGRLAFSGAELTVYFNDRLVAPNTDETYAALKPELGKLFERALGAGAKLVRADDPRDRLTVTARASAAADLATLASRLAG
jgi:hypothetical protein